MHAIADSRKYFPLETSLACTRWQLQKMFTCGSLTIRYTIASNRRFFLFEALLSYTRPLKMRIFRYFACSRRLSQMNITHVETLQSGTRWLWYVGLLSELSISTSFIISSLYKVIYIQKPFCYGVLSAGQQHIYDGDKTGVLQHLIVARVRIDTLYFLILIWVCEWLLFND
jgi:hypothetical protein